jgi:hypothetical protein
LSIAEFCFMFLSIHCKNTNVLSVLWNHQAIFFLFCIGTFWFIISMRNIFYTHHIFHHVS